MLSGSKRRAEDALGREDAPKPPRSMRWKDILQREFVLVTVMLFVGDPGYSLLEALGIAQSDIGWQEYVHGRLKETMPPEGVDGMMPPPAAVRAFRRNDPKWKRLLDTARFEEILGVLDRPKVDVRKFGDLCRCYFPHSLLFWCERRIDPQGIKFMEDGVQPFDRLRSCNPREFSNMVASKIEGLKTPTATLVDHCHAAICACVGSYRGVKSSLRSALGSEMFASVYGEMTTVGDLNLQHLVAHGRRGACIALDAGGRREDVAMAAVKLNKPEVIKEVAKRVYQCAYALERRHYSSVAHQESVGVLQRIVDKITEQASKPGRKDCLRLLAGGVLGVQTRAPGSCEGVSFALAHAFRMSVALKWEVHHRKRYSDLGPITWSAHSTYCEDKKKFNDRGSHRTTDDGGYPVEIAFWDGIKYARTTPWQKTRITRDGTCTVVTGGRHVKSKAGVLTCTEGDTLVVMDDSGLFYRREGSLRAYGVTRRGVYFLLTDEVELFVRPEKASCARFKGQKPIHFIDLTPSP